MQARPCIIQPGNFTGWGSEGVKHLNNVFICTVSIHPHPYHAVKLDDCSTIPACSSLICLLNKGNIVGTNSATVCFWHNMFVHTCSFTFLRLVLLTDSRKGLYMWRVPTCPSLMCSFYCGNIERTNSSIFFGLNVCVCVFCFMFAK